MRLLIRGGVVLSILDSFVGELVSVKFEKVDDMLINTKVSDKILGETIAFAVFCEEVSEIVV
jgi:hypothetical protein